MKSGKCNCSRTDCNKKAYYAVNGKAYCGRHADKSKRRHLPKSTETEKTAQTKAEWLAIQAARKKDNTPGEVHCAKRGVMKIPSEVGFFSVFPNDRATYPHTMSKLFMCQLSPKRMGPVDHNQPGLPKALNLENFHQFNKVFPCELDESGNPLPVFYERQGAAYLDPCAHRHKFERKDLPKQNANMPEYSIFVWIDDSEHRYSYVESRFFYCHFYEQMAKKTNEFAELVSLRNQGYNLLIIGYDGRPIIDLYEMYLDESAPFGHELVLCCLLILDPVDYPWNRFRNEHKLLYPPEL